MENNEFKKLVEAVKKDPALLHALAFEPEKTARKMDFLPETSRTALEGMQAGNLLANALGLLEAEGCGCTNSNSCGCTTVTAGCGYSVQYDSPARHAGTLRDRLNPGDRYGNPGDLASTPAANLNRFATGFYNRFDIGRLNAGCGADATCSCTSATCGGTCGGSTCSVTCSSDSCGSTCGDSCSNTSNAMFDPLEQERLLAAQLNQPLLWR